MELVTWGLVTLLGAFVGSYLAGYLRKKGENLAIHEDIGRLVDQVRAVTTATKEIEAKISSEVWDRQRHWELKRDVMFEATTRLAEADAALLVYASLFQAQHKSDDLTWMEARVERAERWTKAAAAFDETRLRVAIVCGQEAKESFEGLGKLMNEIAVEMSKEGASIYRKSLAELRTKIFAAQSAIRNELEIDGPA